jgi:2-polyprenyl-3-methyl-5-hydroxy-6-metoxy-1,4-benzoquinol methylase
VGRLHNKLVETYAEHFARLNAKIDPRMWTDQDFGPMTATYGDLIAALPVGSKVLDLGCGTGATLAWLSKFPGLVPLGVDASPTQVEIARCALPGVQIECSDGLSYLRRHPQTFNGIICTDVLEHIPGDDLCLEWVEAARDALVPGGLFLCRMPNAANLAGS